METFEPAIPTDPLESIFDMLEDHEEELDISYYYSISRPELEDVFLNVLSRNRTDVSSPSCCDLAL